VIGHQASQESDPGWLGVLELLKQVLQGIVPVERLELA
jgi:hypothetical protein